MNAEERYTEQDVAWLQKQHIFLPPKPVCCGEVMSRERGTATWHCDGCGASVTAP